MFYYWPWPWTHWPQNQTNQISSVYRKCYLNIERKQLLHYWPCDFRTTDGFFTQADQLSSVWEMVRKILCGNDFTLLIPVTLTVDPLTHKTTEVSIFDKMACKIVNRNDGRTNGGGGGRIVTHNKSTRLYKTKCESIPLVFFA